MAPATSNTGQPIQQRELRRRAEPVGQQPFVRPQQQLPQQFDSQQRRDRRRCARSAAAWRRRRPRTRPARSERRQRRSASWRSYIVADAAPGFRDSAIGRYPHPRPLARGGRGEFYCEKGKRGRSPLIWSCVPDTSTLSGPYDDRITTNRVPWAERTSSSTPLSSDCCSIAALNSSTDLTGLRPTWTMTMPAASPAISAGLPSRTSVITTPSPGLDAEFLGHVGGKVGHFNPQFLVLDRALLAGRRRLAAGQAVVGRLLAGRHVEGHPLAVAHHGERCFVPMGACSTACWSSCGLPTGLPANSRITSPAFTPAAAAGYPAAPRRRHALLGRTPNSLARSCATGWMPTPRYARLDVAAGDQLLADPLGQVAGDGEADALVAAAVGRDGGVDADDLAVEIHQRAAAIAGIDGGVGLDEVLARGDAQAASLRADDARRDGAFQSERIAEGQHPVAHLDVVAVAEFCGRKRAGALDAEHGQIGLRIGLVWMTGAYSKLCGLCAKQKPASVRMHSMN